MTRIRHLPSPGQVYQGPHGDVRRVLELGRKGSISGTVYVEDDPARATHVVWFDDVERRTRATSVAAWMLWARRAKVVEVQA